MERFALRIYQPRLYVCLQFITIATSIEVGGEERPRFGIRGYVCTMLGTSDAKKAKTGPNSYHGNDCFSHMQN